jgi:ADP-heptose:LPS heptosyltransferase
MRRKRLDSMQNILVIRAGALGDCLLMLPVLNALRAHAADARIDVMGYPERWAWVVGRGLVDAVHSIERPGMHWLFCRDREVPEPLKSFFGAYDAILSYRPDPEGVFEHSLRALGARLVVSHPPFPPPPPPKIHVADFALQPLHRLGVQAPLAAPRIRLSDEDLALVRPFFDSHQVDPSAHPIVVVHPGSGSAAKRWPAEKFAALLEALETELAVQTLIVVGYAEEDIGARLLSRLHAARPLVAENWPLLPTMALIGQATVFVGHDSGLTHLAAALGRPTVAIFGPTDPAIWGPRGAHVTVVQIVKGDALGKSSMADGRTLLTVPSDIRQVVEGVKHWLTLSVPRQSPGDRSARS